MATGTSGVEGVPLRRAGQVCPQVELGVREEEPLLVFFAGRAHEVVEPQDDLVGTFLCSERYLYPSALKVHRGGLPTGEGECAPRHLSPNGQRPWKNAEQWYLPAAGSTHAPGARPTHRGLGLEMESSHSLARVQRLPHPLMAVAHDSRAAGVGEGCGHEPSRLPYCSTKN